jgi:hypothetical protein
MKEMTPDAILQWLNITCQTIEEYQVDPKNIYNIDESGLAIGSTQGAYVIIDAGSQSAFQAQPGQQEWVTVVEYIYGNGSVIDPLVIFRGTNLNIEWLVSKEYASGWQFLASRRGWTSDVHVLEGLRHHSKPTTREKANGRY